MPLGSPGRNLAPQISSVHRQTLLAAAPTRVTPALGKEGVAVRRLCADHVEPGERLLVVIVPVVLQFERIWQVMVWGFPVLRNKDGAPVTGPDAIDPPPRPRRAQLQGRNRVLAAYPGDDTSLCRLLRREPERRTLRLDSRTAGGLSPDQALAQIDPGRGRPA